MKCQKCSKEHAPEITCNGAETEDLYGRANFKAPGWGRFGEESDGQEVKCGICWDRGRGTDWYVQCQDCKALVMSGRPMGLLEEKTPGKLRRMSCECGRAVNLVEDLDVTERPCPAGCEAAQQWIDEAITGIRVTDGPSSKP